MTWSGSPAGGREPDNLRGFRPTCRRQVGLQLCQPAAGHRAPTFSLNACFSSFASSSHRGASTSACSTLRWQLSVRSKDLREAVDPVVAAFGFARFEMGRDEPEQALDE